MSEGDWFGSRRGKLEALVGWACLIQVVFGGGASVPYGFVDRKVASGFQIPTDFAFFPGGDESKFLVLEKAGYVRYVENGVRQSQPVLDLRSLVNNYLDRTLLSIAIDVKFYSGKPYIYLAYALETGGKASAPKTGQIARFKLSANGKSGDLGSKLVLLGTETGAGCGGKDLSLNIICCESTTHCVGGIDQSPDGILWITIGDGAFPQITTDGLALRSQMPDALNGKVVRIKRNGRGAEDNPRYSGTGTSNSSKIFGYGLRNGWRIHYDSLTKGGLVADVGWGRLESVKLALSNINHRWPCSEADEVTAAFSGYSECGAGFPQIGVAKDPVEVYGRQKGIAVSSAIRIPFSSWPAEFRNKIFYTDYGLNAMYYFGLNRFGVRSAARTVQFATGLAGPVQLRLGSNGKLYYLSLSAQELRSISYEPDPAPPRVVTLSPPNNSVGIEMSTTVEAGLSKLVLESSLTNAIVVRKLSTNERLPGSTEQIIETRTIRFRPDTELDPNVEYKVRISQLRDPDGQLLSNPRTSYFTTGGGRTRYISDLPFLAETNFLGPVERDMANGGERRGDGLPMEIKGIRFEKGIGGIPLMEVKVTLPTGCSRFQATVGIDDSSNDLEGPKARIQVLKGTTKVFDSQAVLGGPVTRNGPAVEIDADVSGASTVTLIALNGGTGRRRQNLVSWGAARLRCGDFDSVKPAVSEVIPTDGRTEVGINALITIRFSESMDIRFLPNAVRLRSGGLEVGWTPQVNQATTQLTMLLEELSYDTEYVITVSKEARDRVGNRLRTAFQSSFRTKMSPATGSTISLLELSPVATGPGSANFRKGPTEITDPSSLIFSRGLGMIPWSRVVYDVPARCSEIQALIGVDRGSNSRAKCQMYVKGSTTGRTLFEAIIQMDAGAVQINVDVTSEDRISLTARNPDTSIGPVYCNWAALKFVCTDGTLYLSDRTPTSRNGNRVVEDLNGRGARIAFATETDDRTLTFASGIIATSFKRLTYNIPWRCSKLSATYGLHPTAGLEASMSFFVAGSGFTNCASRKFIQGTKPQFIRCGIGGASTLEVQAKKGGDSPTGDVGVLGDPELDCAVGSRKPAAFINPLVESFVMNDEINFSGKGTDFRGLNLPAASLSWSVQQHHCATVCHQHNVFQRNGVRSGKFSVDPHGDYFYYEISLRVCDPPLASGESESAERCSFQSASIYPLTATLTLDSEPSGLLLGIDSLNGQGPLVHTVVVGATVGLSAIAVQDLYTFSEWSHNGSKSATTTVRIRNTNPRSFTAKFES